MYQIEQYIRNLPGGDKYSDSQTIISVSIGFMLGTRLIILTDIYFATVFTVLFSTIGIIMALYQSKCSDKIFRESEASIEIAEVTASQLKAQKARTSDFFSKLDERFINKEISDQNYKELKAKYEIQLKYIQTQIVDAELHE